MPPDDEVELPSAPAPGPWGARPLAERPGKCVECAANRARLVNLAADVMGLRANVERLEESGFGFTMPDGQQILEWALITAAVASAALAVVRVLREARRGE